MHHYRNRLKWKIRNNYVFFIIIVIICTVVALLIGLETYNYTRVKSMEAILDKTYKTVHKRTGLTSQDVEKLRKEHPNFNWEGTWDRERFMAGKEHRRKLEIQKEKEAKRQLLLKERADKAGR